MTIKFAKLQATGNDFVLIQPDEERNWSMVARDMCHRHFGVGADGLIIWIPSMVADMGMRLFNPDGSEAEVCGNGLRCLARYAVEHGLVDKGEIYVETTGGIRAVRIQGELFQVDMGTPVLQPASIPMNVDKNIDIIVDYPVKIQGSDLSLTCLSMGNPHAVCFLEEPVARFPLSEMGPQVENLEIFPNRVNFEIANVLGPQRIIARVWERGVGETMSCGTGACAIVVAARMHSWVDDEVDVILPGGMLTISWDGAGTVKLRGPAEMVFHGEWHEPDESTA